MPWWGAIIGAAAVIVSAASTMVILLSIAGNSASLRIEAIKVGLSVGAGTAGAAALLLAFRRQWLGERTQVHAEDVARDTAYDATQRRVTDLYTKAVEQLGHEKAAVRLGGLYALERLAQDYAEHRQTVVEVVCAYLRMPFQPSTDQETARPDPGAPTNPSAEELQVRLAAQALLARHLRTHYGIQDRPVMPLPRPKTYWDKVRVDLKGAYLHEMSFARCTFWTADFANAYFYGDADFRQAEFLQFTNFERSRFNGGTASFYGASFKNSFTSFDYACFDGDAVFGSATFGSTSSFGCIRFNKAANFSKAKFREGLFDETEFNGEANFKEAELEDSWFEGTQFKEASSFEGATIRLGSKEGLPDGWKTKTVTPGSEKSLLVPIRRKQHTRTDGHDSSDPPIPTA
jgi:uncharacterized protein YjbI with pentapeptide repeats